MFTYSFWSFLGFMYVLRCSSAPISTLFFNVCMCRALPFTTNNGIGEMCLCWIALYARLYSDTKTHFFFPLFLCVLACVCACVCTRRSVLYNIVAVFHLYRSFVFPPFVCLRLVIGIVRNTVLLARNCISSHWIINTFKRNAWLKTCMHWEEMEKERLQDRDKHRLKRQPTATTIWMNL